MLLFVTNAAQPNDLQRFGVVRMVSVGSALLSATRACGRTLHLAVLDGFAEFPSRRDLNVFAFLLAVLLVVFGAVFLAPLFASLAGPRAVFFDVLRNVLAVALVYLVSVGFAVLAITLRVFVKMFQAVLSLVSLPSFQVFEGHASYFNTIMGGGGDVAT